MQQSIFESLNSICVTNNISISALCEEITGSKGNLQTWKKGNIRTDYLIAIAKKFNTSVDSLLGLDTDTEDIMKARFFMKSWLDATDKSILEIEETVGTNYATIKSWSVGKGDFFNDRLSLLADVTGYSVDYILGRTFAENQTAKYSQHPTEKAAYDAEGTKGEISTPDKETT